MSNWLTEAAALARSEGVRIPRMQDGLVAAGHLKEPDPRMMERSRNWSRVADLLDRLEEREADEILARTRMGRITPR